MNILKYQIKKRKAIKDADTSIKKADSIAPENYDILLELAAIAIIDQNKASLGILQHIFTISFERAELIMYQLEKIGIVGPEHGVRPRKILISDKNEAITKINTICCRTSPINLFDYDNMEGHDFEYFCANLLRKNGFINVEVTQGSGDHGIDVLAEKDDITYAIQCKCYSSNIGNAAVQQAHTGKALYHRDVAVVMTNQYFTQQAKEEAATLGVKLWDRDKLNEMIERN